MKRAVPASLVYKPAMIVTIAVLFDGIVPEVGQIVVLVTLFTTRLTALRVIGTLFEFDTLSSNRMSSGEPGECRRDQ